MADDEHSKKSSAFSQRGARVNHILCLPSRRSKDGSQMIRGGKEFFSPLPSPSSCTSATEGIPQGYQLFFGVLWDSCCRVEKQPHTPLPGWKGGDEAV